MIRGDHVRKVLHDVSVEPGATADERRTLGMFTYKLTAATAADVAQRLNEQVGVEPYVIWSNEHQAWWKAGRHGYSVDFEQAGRYSRADALMICADARGGWSPCKPPPEIALPLRDAMEVERTTSMRRFGK